LYIAPEVLKRQYNSKCDVWSCGVIMYVLLCGTHPFSFEVSDEALVRKVRSGIWKFHGEIWNNISEDAKDLIRNLLRIKTDQRLSAEEALRHEWVKTLAPQQPAGEVFKEALGERLLHYKVRNGLEQAALEIVAGQLNEELCAGLDKAGLNCPACEVQELFRLADTDNTGELNYTQFIAATLDRKSQLTEDVVWTAFNVFDANGDGRISKQEAQSVLKSGRIKLSISTNSLNKLMSEDEEDGECGINFAEFKGIVQGAQPSDSSPS